MRTPREARTRHVLTTCLGLLAVGAGALALYWPYEPEPIRVRWVAGLDTAERQSVEQVLGLDAGIYSDGRTWVYTLARVSRDDLRAIVTHPNIEDTHGIDRVRYVLTGRDRWDIVQSFREAARAARHDARVWVTLSVIILISAWSGPPITAVGRWVAGSVPPVTGIRFVLFRVAFGLGLVWAVLYTPFTGYPPTPVAGQRNVTWFADFEIFRILATDAPALAPVQYLAAAAAAGVAIGWGARWFLAALAGSLTLLVLCKLRLDSAHDWGLPLLAVWGLAAVPWPSVTGRGDTRHAGFIVWFPGFIMGLAFLSAALAKVDASGLDWITTGAVRYHFVQDAVSRATDVPLWIASHPTAAIAASFLAVATEATVIVFAVSRQPWRLLALPPLVALLMGFNLFQGVFWPAWWVLLLSFLPWGGWRSRGPSELSARPNRIVATAVGLQLLSSAGGIEIEPFLSNYPMYSTTFESPDAFNARYRREHQRRVLLAVAPAGCAVDVMDTAAEPARQFLSTAGPLEPDRSVPPADLVADVAARVRAAHGFLPSGFVAETVTQSFDFDRGVFLDEIEAWVWSGTSGWTRTTAAPAPCPRQP